MLLKWLLAVSLTCVSWGQETSESTTTKSFVKISGLKLSLTDSTGNELKSHSLVPDSKETFSVEKGQIVRYHFMAYKGTGESSSETIKLDQAVALFNHTSTGTITYAPFGTSKPGSYRLNIGSNNFPKFAQINPGEYEVTLFASANKDYQPTKFGVGIVNFVTTEQPVAPTKVDRYGPRPLIHHTFRQPESLPSPILSYLFSGLVLVPWLFLLGAWFHLGANFSALPFQQPTHLLTAVGFLASLVMNIGLAYYYWFGLPLFPTMFYFVPIAISTMVTGRFALSQVQLRRNITLK